VKIGILLPRLVIRQWAVRQVEPIVPAVRADDF